MVLTVLMSCAHKKNVLGQCSTLGECLEIASGLTGKSYIYDEMQLVDQVGTIGTITWDKENADLLIGELLASAGYFRLDMGKNIYKLFIGRDVRYMSSLKSFTATKESSDPLPSPNAADPVELVYQSKNGEVRVLEITRNLRPLLSRYGRVLSVSGGGGIIIVRDTASVLHQILPLIRKMDAPFSKSEQKALEKSYQLEVLREKTRQEMVAKINEILEKSKKEKSEQTKSP